MDWLSLEDSDSSENEFVDTPISQGQVTLRSQASATPLEESFQLPAPLFHAKCKSKIRQSIINRMVNQYLKSKEEDVGKCETPQGFMEVNQTPVLTKIIASTPFPACNNKRPGKDESFLPSPICESISMRRPSVGKQISELVNLNDVERDKIEHPKSKSNIKKYISTRIKGSKSQSNLKKNNSTKRGAATRHIMRENDASTNNTTQSQKQHVTAVKNSTTKKRQKERTNKNITSEQTDENISIKKNVCTFTNLNARGRRTFFASSEMCLSDKAYDLDDELECDALPTYSYSHESLLYLLDSLSQHQLNEKIVVLQNLIIKSAQKGIKKKQPTLPKRNTRSVVSCIGTTIPVTDDINKSRTAVSLAKSKRSSRKLYSSDDEYTIEGSPSPSEQRKAIHSSHTIKSKPVETENEDLSKANSTQKFVEKAQKDLYESHSSKCKPAKRSKAKQNDKTKVVISIIPDSAHDFDVVQDVPTTNANEANENTLPETRTRPRRVLRGRTPVNSPEKPYVNGNNYCEEVLLNSSQPDCANEAIVYQIKRRGKPRKIVKSAELRSDEEQEDPKPRRGRSRIAKALHAKQIGPKEEPNVNEKHIYISKLRELVVLIQKKDQIGSPLIQYMRNRKPEVEFIKPTKAAPRRKLKAADPIRESPSNSNVIPEPEVEFIKPKKAPPRSKFRATDPIHDMSITNSPQEDYEIVSGSASKKADPKAKGRSRKGNTENQAPVQSELDIGNDINNSKKTKRNNHLINREDRCEEVTSTSTSTTRPIRKRNPPIFECILRGTHQSIFQKCGTDPQTQGPLKVKRPQSLSTIYKKKDKVAKPIITKPRDLATILEESRLLRDRHKINIDLENATAAQETADMLDNECLPAKDSGIQSDSHDLDDISSSLLSRSVFAPKENIHKRFLFKPVGNNKSDDAFMTYPLPKQSNSKIGQMVIKPGCRKTNVTLKNYDLTLFVHAGTGIYKLQNQTARLQEGWFARAYDGNEYSIVNDGYKELGILYVTHPTVK